MAATYITRMSHYDYSDEEARGLPREATRLAEYFGSILRETLRRLPGMPSSTGLRCRRRPGHIPCPGHIQSELSTDGTELHWWCPQCGDNGYISDWEHTRWDPENTVAMPEGPSATITEMHDALDSPTESNVPPTYRIIDGRIDYDRGTDGELPRITASTREYTWQELGRELMTYEGFRVRITIHDSE